MSYENLKLRALTVKDYLIKCQTMAMFASITAYLPYDREKVTSELQYVLDNTDEMEMRKYRNNLKSLG